MTNKNYEFEFSDFRILSSSFKVEANKASEIEKLSEIEVNFQMRHDFNKESNTLMLSLKIDIGGAEVPFTLSMEAGALFTFSHPIEDASHIQKIAEINCAGIAFPYLREAVADITRRGGFPPLHLPPVNFVNTYKRNHPKAEAS